jgi:hypothetical protein
LPKHEVEPVRREVADLRHRFGIADRRTVLMMPAPAAEPAPSGVQLALELEAPERQRQKGRSRVA